MQESCPYNRRKTSSSRKLALGILLFMFMLNSYSGTVRLNYRVTPTYLFIPHCCGIWTQTAFSNFLLQQLPVWTRELHKITNPEKCVSLNSLVSDCIFSKRSVTSSKSSRMLKQHVLVNFQQKFTVGHSFTFQGITKNYSPSQLVSNQNTFI